MRMRRPADTAGTVMSDPVNQPKHYNQGDVECIDAIRASMGAEGFAAYCKGNTLKYLWRYRYKGKAVQDLHKAEWYLRRLIETVQGEEDAASRP